jgi:hypothetical protein
MLLCAPYARCVVLAFKNKAMDPANPTANTRKYKRLPANRLNPRNTNATRNTLKATPCADVDSMGHLAEETAPACAGVTR